MCTQNDIMAKPAELRDMINLDPAHWVPQVHIMWKQCQLCKHVHVYECMLTDLVAMVLFKETTIYSLSFVEMCVVRSRSGEGVSLNTITQLSLYKDTNLIISLPQDTLNIHQLD